MLIFVTAGRQLTEAGHVFGKVFRNADLRRLELGWAASNLASRASAIAVAVYAYETHGIGAVGLIAFARLAVAAAASPWLAVLADRRPRRQVLIGSDLVRCLIFGAMATLVLVDASATPIYVLAVLAAVVEPLFRSAQVAFTPSLVETPEELTGANVIASAVESVGLFAGPALGALLLVSTGTGAVFAVSASLLVVSIALVARIGLAGEPSPDVSAAHSHTLLAGWKAIVSEPSLRVVITLFSVQTLVAGMFNVLVVVLAIELLDLGTAGVGWLDGIVGIGAALGVLAVAGIAGRSRLSGYFAVGLLLWGVPLVLLSAWPEPVAAFVLLTLLGVGNTLVDVTGVTLMQRASPDEVLGRVFGAFEALVAIGMGLGSLVTPLLVSALGARGATLVAGLILPVILVPLWRPLTSIDRRAAAPYEQVELLRSVPIFSPLAAPALERLAKALVETRAESGAVIFDEGARGDDFYVIADGRASVEIGGTSIRTLGPRDFFGEVALLQDVPRTATVRAITPLRLLGLDRETFVATVTGHPASAQAAGSIVSARLPGPGIA
ncbi:MAG: MFS transporter [Gaiellaceae bacterium]